MTIQYKLAPGETHDPQRQQTMRERALCTAQQLAEQEGVLGILLTGSVARGPVSASSDLDMHVIVTDNCNTPIPEWTFHEQNIMENLHTLRESDLLNGWNMLDTPSDLADWFCETKIGDELHGFVPIWWSPDTPWQERITKLVAARQDTNMAKQIAKRYLQSAKTRVTVAQKACYENAPLDGHHQLRLAFQTVLVAALIDRGWTTRGAKKRIEIGHSFLPDPLIENMLSIGSEIIGLANITADSAKQTCDLRLKFRNTFMNELYDLRTKHAHDTLIANKLENAIKIQEAHEAMAYDYYSPLIDQGILCGPINHIRCISGMIRVPQLFVSCLAPDTATHPVTEFIHLDISRTIREEWLEIMDLNTSSTEIIKLSSRLTTVVEKL